MELRAAAAAVAVEGVLKVAPSPRGGILGFNFCMRLNISPRLGGALGLGGGGGAALWLRCGGTAGGAGLLLLLLPTTNFLDDVKDWEDKTGGGGGLADVEAAAAEEGETRALAAAGLRFVVVEKQADEGRGLPATLARTLLLCGGGVTDEEALG